MCPLPQRRPPARAVPRARVCAGRAWCRRRCRRLRLVSQSILLASCRLATRWWVPWVWGEAVSVYLAHR
eukprot:11338160-Alexandrium_andersonii.AAC.1